MQSDHHSRGISWNMSVSKIKKFSRIPPITHNTMHACTHTHTHMHTQTHAHLTRTHTDTHTHAHMYTLAHAHAHTHAHTTHRHTHMHTQTHTHMHTHTHAHTHTRTHTPHTRVNLSIFSSLYQIAHLGDNDDETEFSSSMQLEEGETFFFAPRGLKNLVQADEIESLSPIISCQVWGCGWGRGWVCPLRQQ